MLVIYSGTTRDPFGLQMTLHLIVSFSVFCFKNVQRVLKTFATNFRLLLQKFPSPFSTNRILSNEPANIYVSDAEVYHILMESISHISNQLKVITVYLLQNTLNRNLKNSMLDS